MALTINVKHDLNRLQVSLGSYPNHVMGAATRAINRSMVTIRTQAVRDMRAALGGIKAGVVQRQLRMTNARRGKLDASLEFSAKRFRLLNFDARQTTTGVRLRKMPWRLETLDGEPVTPADLRHAFIQRARTNNSAHVWVRVGKKRYPITAILAPSLAEAFVQRHIGEALVRIGHARFRAVLDQEMRFRLSRL